MHRILCLAFMICLALPALSQELIRFKPGESATTVSGEIGGWELKHYIFRAAGGQKIRLRLESERPSWLVVQIYSPKSDSADVFNNFVTGDLSCEETLPTDGEYLLKIGIRRPQARRGHRLSYRAHVEIPPLEKPALKMEEGDGVYFVGGRPAIKARSVGVLLEPNGSAQVAVDLNGDGFTVTGRWESDAGDAVKLTLDGGFGNTGLSGHGLLVRDASGNLARAYLYFYVPSQKTHHSFSFTSTVIR